MEELRDKNDADVITYAVVLMGQICHSAQQSRDLLYNAGLSDFWQQNETQMEHGLCFWWVLLAFLAHSSTLKMEAVRSCETSIHF
jgi:hypothetical protein